MWKYAIVLLIGICIGIVLNSPNRTGNTNYKSKTMYPEFDIPTQILISMPEKNNRKAVIFKPTRQGSSHDTGVGLTPDTCRVVVSGNRGIWFYEGPITSITEGQ